MWTQMWTFIEMLRDATAKAIQPSDKPLADGTVTGLRLHPTKTKGRGVWKLRYVSPVSHLRRDMSFGVYPDVSIADARLLANAARSEIAKGADPKDVRDSAKRSVKHSRTDLTFMDAATQVHTNLKGGWKNAKHQDQWINTLTTYVFPFIGSRPVNEIDVRNIEDVLKPIWLTKPETASRVKQRCSQVMEWCWAQGLVSANPVSVVHHLLPKQPSTRERVEHYPAMPWKLIPSFVVGHIENADNVTRALLLFVILTAVRSGEARGARWSEFDIDQKVWTIPASRMKAKVLHRVPLSSPVLALIEKQKNVAKHILVFPSPTGKILTDMALTAFLRKHKATSDTPGRCATAHGFRSSFRDWASENGFANDWAERALAHTIREQTKAAYYRTDLLEQRRHMMEAWGTHVLSNL
jgi:integrase